jgi:hypothetical protein
MRLIHKKLISFVFVAFVIFSLISGVGVGGRAYADTAINGYSNVLDDLQKDETFKIEDYPSIENDYSLQVIQIAESTGGELFVYVYQPCANTLKLTATEIRLSQSIGENIAPKDYNLMLLNQDSVLSKYKVEDLKVKSDVVRYYEIIQICRLLYDGETNKDDSGNIIENVSCPVSKRFTVCTLDNNVSYSCIDISTIEVIPESKHVGYFRYFDGLGFICIDKADCWFVGFDTNKPIDNLQEAEISFRVREIDTSYGYGIQMSQKLGEWKYFKDFVVKGEEMASAGNGFLAKKFEWSRIYSVEKFKALEGVGLNESGIENLSGCKWVLCFYETPYKKEGDYKINHVVRSEMNDVSILRLKFETDGNFYNLGVIDNKQTVSPNQPPDGIGGGLDFSKPLGLPWWAWLIIAVVAVITIVCIVKFGIKVILKGIGYLIYYIFYGVFFIITSPFRLIAFIVKKRKGCE